MAFSRPIRIAGASGSASDRRHAMAAFAKAYPQDPVDVIISDYMSEANMVTAAARKVDSSTAGQSYSDSNPLSLAAPAYEASFLEALEPALEDLHKHKIKVAVNAGASDPEGLYRIVCDMIRERGLSIPVAWISGDEVMPAVETALKNGSSQFKNIYTGQKLSDWQFEPLYAQAYLGGLGIAEAFAQGAQIVIAGRVSDASPVIGSAFWYHQWKREQLHELANAFVAGHLIECSNYVTGGNFSGFRSLENAGWDDIGYPIAEISNNGDVVITKQKNSGGVVTIDTCSSQLVYEIQGPYYYNSDVTALLEGLWFEQIGTDRVALHGVKGAPPPPTTKVGITARGGFQAEAYYFLTGLHVKDKARMLEAQLRKGLAPYSDKFTNLSFGVLGSAAPDADNQNAATTVFRTFVQAKNADDISPKKFLRPFIDNIMQGFPGSTFHLDFRQGIPKPYFEYYVTLLPQSAIQHTVHFNGTNIVVSPPKTTYTYPERQPSKAGPNIMVNLDAFGLTERLPLGTIVHARSGDKGSDCNCGFWVRHNDEYTWLRNLLTIDKIKQLLGQEYDTSRVPKIEIERFELYNMRGVHFLFRNLLDRGVTSTSSVDFLGKNCAEFLRNRHVDIPVKFLSRSKL